MPALDNVSPLMAASERERPVAIDAIKAIGSARAIKSALVGLSTLAEGGEVAGFKIIDLAEFLGVDIDPGDDPAGFISALKAKVSDLVAKLDGVKAPVETPDSPDAEALPAEEMAAAKEILRIEGVSTFTTALGKFATYRESYMQLAEERAKVAAEKAKLEKTERAELCAKLLKANCEDEDTIKDLATLSLVRLRERTAKALERKGLQDSVPNAGTKPMKSAPAARTEVVNGVGVELTENDLLICKETGCEPATFAMLKARRAAHTAA